VTMLSKVLGNGRITEDSKDGKPLIRENITD
jgi:hypothetical protein